MNGYNKRMRELQAIFATQARFRFFPHTLAPYTAVQYGKSFDWKAEKYRTHDVASIFRRYLTLMPVRGSTLDTILIC